MLTHVRGGMLVWQYLPWQPFPGSLSVLSPLQRAVPFESAGQTMARASTGCPLWACYHCLRSRRAPVWGCCGPGACGRREGGAVAVRCPSSGRR